MMEEELKGNEEDQQMAGENEEEVLAQKQLSEFNEFLHKCRELFNSDPTRVSERSS